LLREYENLQKSGAEDRERILKAFELEKTLKDDEWNYEKKWHKRIAKGVYKSFEATYP